MIRAMLSISLANTKFCSSFLNNYKQNTVHVVVVVVVVVVIVVVVVTAAADVVVVVVTIVVNGVDFIS